MTLFGVSYPVGSGEDTNRYGDPVLVEDTGVVVPCQVRPQGRGMDKEELMMQDRRVSFFHVLVPYPFNFDGLSRIEWEGRQFELVGEPQPLNFRNGPHHYEFTMRSIAGG